MVNRDVLEKVHKRMANELVATFTSREGLSAGMTPLVKPHAKDVPSSRNWCRIAQDQSNKLFLLHLLSDPQNAADLAFKVCTSMWHVAIFKR